MTNYPVQCTFCCISKHSFSLSTDFFFFEVNKAPVAFIFSHTLSDFWRENTGSVNRLALYLSSQASSRGKGFPHQLSKPKAAEMGLDEGYVVITLFPFPNLMMVHSTGCSFERNLALRAFPWAVHFPIVATVYIPCNTPLLSITLALL